jgi:hypothetical protein
MFLANQRDSYWSGCQFKVGVMVYLIGVIVIICAYIYAYDCVYMRYYISMVGLVRPLTGRPLAILSSTIGL